MSHARPLTYEERADVIRDLEVVLRDLPEDLESVSLRATGRVARALALTLTEMERFHVDPDEVIGRDVAIKMKPLSSAVEALCADLNLPTWERDYPSGVLLVPFPCFTAMVKHCLNGLLARQQGLLFEQLAAARTASIPLKATMDDSLYKYGHPFTVTNARSVCCPGCGTVGTQPDGALYSPPEEWSMRHPDLLVQCNLCRSPNGVNTAFADSVRFKAAESSSAEFVFVETGTGLTRTKKIPFAGKRKKGTVTNEKKKKTIKEQGVDLGEAAGLGVAMAATNQSGEVLIDIAKALGNGNPMFEALLEDPTLRELIKASLALLLYGAAENAPGVMPKPEAIAKIAKLQVTWSTAMLSNGGLAKLRPHLMKLAEIGDTLPALGAGSDKNELDAIAEERVAEKVAR